MRGEIFNLLRSVIAAVIVTFLWTASASPVHAQSTSLQRMDDVRAGELIIPLNKSQTVRVDRSFADLLVGNPEIADVLALSDRSVYILGKKIGSTSLTIYGANKRLIAVTDLNVTADIEGLKSKLFEILPNEEIEVRAVNDSIVLSGTLQSATDVSRVMALAERYAPDKVTSFLQARGGQQVMLQVRFAEVQRSTVKDLGLNADLLYSGGSANFQILSGDGLDPSLFASGLLDVATGNFSLQFLFDALEEKGLVKTLAEPNLIALSGDTANFLAGGEFPIPIAQSGSSAGGTPVITVEFKEFGVSLAFTPTVLPDGLINLVVAPEVSQIDRTNSITVTGFAVPGLTTRRARTTVELRDGQSFAIAGLLQSDFQDQVRQFPWIGDIPVLGALFRSSNYQRRETELVILVTPRLVKPARAGTLASPVDRFVPPSEQDLFFHGRIESPQSGRHDMPVTRAGGITSPYGHILK